MCKAQQWEYITHDTAQEALSFVLPADDGGHFGLNNFGNQYTVIRYDANDAVVWSQYVECQDDIWISSFYKALTATSILKASSIKPAIL